MSNEEVTKFISNFKSLKIDNQKARPLERRCVTFKNVIELSSFRWVGPYMAITHSSYSLVMKTSTLRKVLLDDYQF